MRDIWTEGSSARKRGWYDPPLHTGHASYHPSQQERKNQKSVTVEYIQTPEYYALNHPVKHAINTHAQAAVEKTVKICNAIPTVRISEINQGMILANQWINMGIGFAVALCALIEWCWVLFAPMDIAIRAEYLWQCGLSTATICTICILIYRYHQILHVRLNRAGGLRKRNKIIGSTKKTVFMFGRTLLVLYGILVPHIAKILGAILS